MGLSTVVNQTKPFGWGHCTRIMHLQKASKVEMLTNKQLEMISTHRHKWISGWWFQPLWKIWKSVGMIIPNIWKVLKVMFQPTNQIYWSCPRMIRTTDYVYTRCCVKSCHPPLGYSGKRIALSATTIGQRPHAPKKKRDHVSSITLEYGYVWVPSAKFRAWLDPSLVRSSIVLGTNPSPVGLPGFARNILKFCWWSPLLP